MILSDFLCGLGSSSQSKLIAEADTALLDNGRANDGQQQPSDAAYKKGCIFCNPQPDKFNIILENERFVVFSDRSPVARHHLLAVPRFHIPNVQSLHDDKGIKLVEDLLSIGSKALEKVAEDDAVSGRSKAGLETRYGFHIPPIRTVDHLHLHCLELPFNSAFKAFGFRIAPGNPLAKPPTHKGWGWFVTAEQTMAILRDRQTVKLSPCAENAKGASGANARL